jgi:hypothetical protein
VNKQLVKGKPAFHKETFLKPLPQDAPSSVPPATRWASRMR